MSSGHDDYNGHSNKQNNGNPHYRINSLQNSSLPSDPSSNYGTFSDQRPKVSYLPDNMSDTASMNNDVVALSFQGSHAASINKSVMSHVLSTASASTHAASVRVPSNYGRNLPRAHLHTNKSSIHGDPLAHDSLVHPPSSRILSQSGHKHEKHDETTTLVSPSQYNQPIDQYTIDVDPKHKNHLNALGKDNNGDDTESNNDGIPYDHFGHLLLPYHEQLYYEHYRNPDNNPPLPCIFRPLRCILRTSLERRILLVEHQNNVSKMVEQLYNSIAQQEHQHTPLLASSPLQYNSQDHVPIYNGIAGINASSSSASVSAYAQIDSPLLLPKRHDTSHINNNTLLSSSLQPSSSSNFAPSPHQLPPLYKLDSPVLGASNRLSYPTTTTTSSSHNHNDISDTTRIIQSDDIHTRPSSSSPLEASEYNKTQQTHTSYVLSLIDDNKLDNHIKLPTWNEYFLCFSWPFRSEFFSILALSFPLTFSLFAGFGINLINLSFQGHISEEALAAAASAVFYMNITGLSIMIGLNNGIDTLGSHAYGARQHKRVGLITQRGMAVITLTMIAIAASWWFSGPAIEFLGIEHTTSIMAQDYIRLCIYAIPPLGYIDALRRFLEVQQSVWPSLIITTLGVVLVAPLNMLFVNYLDHGFVGPAYSYIILNWTMLFILILYIWLSGAGKKSWPYPSCAIFKEWGSYLSYSLPAVGAVASEWIGFEVQTLIAARLGTAQLATQSLLASVNAFTYFSPMATGMAASARIGNFLGGNKAYPAVYSCRMAVFITIVTQSIFCVIMASLSRNMISIFTNQDSVINIAVDTLPFLCISLIFDGMQGMLAGVFRGVGKVNISFWIALLGYWVVAIPLSMYLTHHVGTHTYIIDGEPQTAPGLGLAGIWLSTAAGGLLVSTLYLIILGCMNWRKRAQEVYDETQSLQEAYDAEYNQASHQDDDDDDDDGNDMQGSNNNNNIAQYQPFTNPLLLPPTSSSLPSSSASSQPQTSTTTGVVQPQTSTTGVTQSSLLSPHIIPHNANYHDDNDDNDDDDNDDTHSHHSSTPAGLLLTRTPSGISLRDAPSSSSHHQHVSMTPLLHHGMPSSHAISSSTTTPTQGLYPPLPQPSPQHNIASPITTVPRTSSIDYTTSTLVVDSSRQDHDDMGTSPPLGGLHHIDSSLLGFTPNDATLN